jgi:CDP-diacylglycerol---glycerol-3-phosphate 3-phosphatidyltransferase
MPDKMMDRQLEHRTALSQLQRRWAITALTSALFVLTVFTLLQGIWQLSYAGQWLIQASLGLIYLLKVLWRGLESNHRIGETHLLPGFGAGNTTTILRGVLIASLLGFLLLPRPSGWLAWLPAVFYTLAVLADFLDGFLARRTQRVTRLGEILDMSFDGLGVLVASLLAIQYSQVPAWYILVALARYIFLAGTWLRRRRGLPVHELQPSVRRRAFAGVQMGFLFFILMPIFTPPGTYIAAAMFALPFLVGFAIDWLAVCGVRFVNRPSQGRLKALSLDRLPILLRLLAIILILAELNRFLGLYSGWLSGQLAPRLPQSQTGFLLLIALQSVVLVTLALGVSGRVAAIVGLCLLGIQQLFASLTPAQIALALLYTAILYLGTGALSLWKPEDQLIFSRVGERPGESPT